MKVFKYIHEWSSIKESIVFHTFPMIHIGQKTYYDEISTMLNEMNQVLIEGISQNKKSELGSYNNFAAILGLETQKNCLKIPEDMHTINIDIPGNMFKSEINQLPLFEKMKLFLMELTLRKISTKQAVLLSTLKNIYSYREESRIKLINPENHYAFTHKSKSKFELLIENKRNELIQNNIEKYIIMNNGRKYRMDIAILFGDAHMPYIYETLKKKGYKWKLEKTIEIF